MLFYQQILGEWEREKKFEDKSPEMEKNKDLFQESKKDQCGIEINLNQFKEIIKRARQS